jgi:hypothetical protein
VSFVMERLLGLDGSLAPSGSLDMRQLFRWFVTFSGQLPLLGELRLHVQRHPPVLIPTSPQAAPPLQLVTLATAPPLAARPPSGAPPLVPVP